MDEHDTMILQKWVPSDQVQLKCPNKKFRRQAESDLGVSVQMICSTLVTPSQSHLNKSITDHSWNGKPSIKAIWKSGCLPEFINARSCSLRILMNSDLMFGPMLGQRKPQYKTFMLKLLEFIPNSALVVCLFLINVHFCSIWATCLFCSLINCSETAFSFHQSGHKQGGHEELLKYA